VFGGSPECGIVLTANGFVDMDSRPSQLKTCFEMLVLSHSTRPALFWRLRPTLADRLENDGLMRTRRPGGYRPEFLGEPSVAMSWKPVSSPRMPNSQIWRDYEAEECGQPTRAGLAAAAANGCKGERPRKVDAADPANAHQLRERGSRPATSPRCWEFPARPCTATFPRPLLRESAGLAAYAPAGQEDIW